MLAVHMALIPFGMRVDAVPRDFDQVLAFAEDQRAGRARLHAAGKFPFLETRMAQRALLDQRIEGAVVGVAGNVERARNHAVTAAHTEGGIVGHGTVGVLGKRLHETRAGAGGFLAVHALGLAEHVLVEARGAILVHHGPLFGGRAALLVEHVEIGKGLFRLGKVVDLVAGLFAPAAADAQRGVVQHAVAVGIPVERPARGGRGFRAAESRTDAEATHQSQKGSTVHIFSSPPISHAGCGNPHNRWRQASRPSSDRGRPCTVDDTQP